jgi:hypothetical protein
MLQNDTQYFKISPSVRFYNAQLKFLLGNNLHNVNKDTIDNLFLIANQVQGFPNEDTTVILATALQQGVLPSSISADKILALALSTAAKSSKKLDERVTTALISFWDSEDVAFTAPEKIYALLKYLCSTSSQLQDVSTYKSLSFLLREHPDKTPNIVDIMKRFNVYGDQLLIPYNILLTSCSYEAFDAYIIVGKDNHVEGVSPDVLSLNIVLDRLCHERPPKSIERSVDLKFLKHIF